jgi:predicted membrane-bound dolichyl-phosphate-mannose-protein mannosyltransferase
MGEHLSASGGFITQLRSGNLIEPPGTAPLAGWSISLRSFPYIQDPRVITVYVNIYLSSLVRSKIIG